MPLSGMQAVRPQAISDLVRAAEEMRIAHGPEQVGPAPRNCQRCGYMSSQMICKACLLLEGLNRGLPSLGVGKQRGGKHSAPLQAAANASCNERSMGSAPLQTGTFGCGLDNGQTLQDHHCSCLGNGSKLIGMHVSDSSRRSSQTQGQMAHEL